MRGSTIVLAVGLCTTPVALVAAASRGEETPAIWPIASPQREATFNGRVLTDAPVPTVGPRGVSQEDRVAGSGSRTLDAGPTNSTPFSSTPTGTLSSGGTQISNSDRVNAPADTSGVTPNLGK